MNYSLLILIDFFTVVKISNLQRNYFSKRVNGLIHRQAYLNLILFCLRCISRFVTSNKQNDHSYLYAWQSSGYNLLKLCTTYKSDNKLSFEKELLE